MLPTTAGSPIDPATPIVQLAHLAAVTRRMTLGTAVIILPQRNPLMLAKQAASLDAMTALWTDPAPEFHGRHFDFSDVDAHPRPSGIRVVVGGRSRAAYRRAVGRAHGFYGNGTPEEIAGDALRLQESRLHAVWLQKVAFLRNGGARTAGRVRRRRRSASRSPG